VQRGRRKVGDDLPHPQAGGQGPDRLAGGCVGQQQRPEVLLGGVVGLVARRGGVGEIVGELVLADLLDKHPLRGDIEADVHVDPILGCPSGNL
jgi:hypothetical protein